MAFAIFISTCLSLSLADEKGALLLRELIYEKAPFPSCHAATLVETRDGIATAWFGGSAEGNSDVGIWLARRGGKSWSEPVEVASGIQDDGRRFPSWNPVLFQPKEGPLLLFYKVGPSPSRWWGMLARSSDGGKTWSKPSRLPDGVLGPIKNKPVELASGSILCPSSTEYPGEGWRAHLELTSDLGATWKRIGPLNDDTKVQAIQPAILTWPGGKMQVLCRNRNRGELQGKIAESWSEDGGKTWIPMQLTDLVNPNSGIDAVSLKDGRALLVYNRTPQGRTPLNVAVSPDGKAWKDVLVLEDEPGEYSYPAVIQAADGKVHIAYTWRRQRIQHVVLDPSKL